MGQIPQEGWLRRPNGTAEMLNEGDGNFLLRSAMNRDRTIRLTGSEMEQVAMLVFRPGSLIAAPEPVSRDG